MTATVSAVEKPVRSVDEHPAVRKAWSVFCEAQARYEGMCDEASEGDVTDAIARKFLSGADAEVEVAVERATARAKQVAQAGVDLALRDVEAAKEQARAEICARERPVYADSVLSIAEAFEAMAVAVLQERQVRQDLQARDLFLQRYIPVCAPPQTVVLTDISFRGCGSAIAGWAKSCIEAGLLDPEWRTRLS